MANPKGNWTREEHILAFNLYSQIPFGTIHIGNPKIIQLAKLLGRSVGSVSYKLANFLRLDPALQARGIRGMPHGAKGEVEVWQEFADHPEELVFESEQILAKFSHLSIEKAADIETRDLPPPGIEREAIVRVRVNQSFFRRRILSAYDYRCCVTGLAFQPLLVASHIVPWSADPINRLNPRNGLCLNAIHDRAFDRGLMWIEEPFTIRFSKEFQKHSDDLTQWLVSYESAELKFAGQFRPDKNFLRLHAEQASKQK